MQLDLKADLKARFKDPPCQVGGGEPSVRGAKEHRAALEQTMCAHLALSA